MSHLATRIVSARKVRAGDIIIDRNGGAHRVTGLRIIEMATIVLYLDNGEYFIEDGNTLIGIQR